MINEHAMMNTVHMKLPRPKRGNCAPIKRTLAHGSPVFYQRDRPFTFTFTLTLTPLSLFSSPPPR